MVVPRTGALPEYAAVAAAMQRCSMPQSPAETQGFALGLHIAGMAEPLALWRQELYSDLDPADVLANECRDLLDQVFASVFVAEDAESMQLALLLPQDIEVDRARVGAVRDWCQGFLFGFGLGGESLTARLSGEARELLRDITEMTRLDTDEVENSAENQAALIEIEEFLRVGVMLMRDELRIERDQNEPQ
jgi:uncharacterized protein YgfB (UPF0149 family)